MIVVLVLAFSAKSHAQAIPETDDEKAFYSIGASMAAQLKRANPISESELLTTSRPFRTGDTRAPRTHPQHSRHKSLWHKENAPAVSGEGVHGSPCTPLRTRIWRGQNGEP